MSDPSPVALIVEDEPSIRRFVRMALEAEGWQVHECETVRQGLIDAGTRRPELIVLDLGLPDDDGINYLKDLRAWSGVPVIVLSARASEADKIAALDAGADDYLTKPFGVGELMARVRVALRRSQSAAAAGEPAQTVFRFGAVEVDLAARRVLRGGQAVHLTPIEYRLLTHLIANAGKVLTHRQLLKAVWGPSHVEDNHYLRVYMGQLRQKLEDQPAQPRHLLTETAVGYRLMP
ncbi:two-component system response regulator KdpE [Paucibacter sp. O1-1]|uniref:two-component system response regulator KdpE n=1 Tax=Paucibacter sp. M5-1 TaxID=3015998 RepID=UPI0021D4BCC8|nr:two-component system response regulator KdpE [Paucibacter sp. M5-1]MCU7373292.1 two-component system response regulator KdpE [Paucibacter sp. O1-1]MCZ7879585.1 two-component system response regulator KdpE [Paucibacter sp. M5-1]MDA3828291.1 two-component system response regulator KdpE [Paucibacter sp. O1-1]